MSPVDETVAAAAVSLASGYAGLVCDLDGVVYRGPDAVPGAVAALGAIGIPVIYATNNASRPPSTVLDHLRGLGISLELDDVVTSAQAGADHLADALPPGSPVLAIGGPGVVDALTERGLQPVSPPACRDGATVVAVLQGYGPQVAAADLAEAAYAIAAGAAWVATNADLTLPTDRGTAPGNGTLVAAVRQVTGVDPHVVGKPQAPLYLLAAQRLDLPPARLLGVGDRLDTDIEGAVSAGLDSVLVLTGVDTPVSVAGAPPHQRPTYVVPDLAAVLEPYAAVVRDGDGWVCGDVRCRRRGERLEFDGDPGTVEGIRAGLAVLHEGVDRGDLTGADARALASTVW